ncbi:hypothetical protein STEG23_020966 [Scotinomys teguina]
MFCGFLVWSFHGVSDFLDILWLGLWLTWSFFLQMQMPVTPVIPDALGDVWDRQEHHRYQKFHPGTAVTVALFSPNAQVPRWGQVDPEERHKQNLSPKSELDLVHSMFLYFEFLLQGLRINMELFMKFFRWQHSLRTEGIEGTGGCINNSIALCQRTRRLPIPSPGTYPMSFIMDCASVEYSLVSLKFKSLKISQPHKVRATRPRPPRSFAFTYKRSILLYADPTVSREIYLVNPPAYHSSGLSPLFAFPFGPPTGHQLCRATTPTSRNETRHQNPSVAIDQVLY